MSVLGAKISENWVLGVKFRSHLPNSVKYCLLLSKIIGKKPLEACASESARTAIFIGIRALGYTIATRGPVEPGRAAFSAKDSKRNKGFGTKLFSEIAVLTQTITLFWQWQLQPPRLLSAAQGLLLRKLILLVTRPGVLLRM